MSQKKNKVKKNKSKLTAFDALNRLLMVERLADLIKRLFDLM